LVLIIDGELKVELIGLSESRLNWINREKMSNFKSKRDWGDDDDEEREEQKLR
jgi:hypothetical protein